MPDPVINRIPAGVSGKLKAPKAKAPPWTDDQRAAFVAKATEACPTLKVTINGQEFLAALMTFSSGSVGYHLNGRQTMVVDGKAITLLIGGNFTVQGSKPEAK